MGKGEFEEKNLKTFEESSKPLKTPQISLKYPQKSFEQNPQNTTTFFFS